MLEERTNNTTLTSREFEVYILWKFEDMTGEGTGEELDITASTVRDLFF